jgi:hypothetical protein
LCATAGCARSPVDALSAQFLADYAHLLAQKVALLSRYTALECNFALKQRALRPTRSTRRARKLALTLVNATILLDGTARGRRRAPHASSSARAPPVRRCS